MLFVVGTPIGNLGDLTIRAAEVLGSVDAVICEDSRRTGKLLAHLGERQHLLVANDHTEVSRLPEILERLEQGQRLALVTDAGMPTISDPGARIVRAVAEAGHAIEVIPGPTAISAALALSGIDATPFVFEGFLPRKGGERSSRLSALGAESRTIVLYEAPHRLRRTLQDLATACGPDRPAAICRELTKLHEEVRRGPLRDHIDWWASTEPRGEFVLVVEGRPERSEPMSDDELATELTQLLEAGSSRRDAVAAVAAASGTPRRRVYELANALPTGAAAEGEAP